MTRTRSHVWMARLARDLLARCTGIACSHVSGLLMQSVLTAGPDGVRQPRPHHSSGIDVRLRRQVCLGCVGSTDCAVTRHCSLASSSAQLGSLSRRGRALVIFLPVHHRQAMRAVLFANATATTRLGRRRRNPITQGSALVAFERSRLALAPLIISRRKY